jgi:hypothetical protein
MTKFRLLPQALDLSLTPSEQSFAAGRVILAEEDRCLHVSAIHLLEQDRYVTQLEQRRCQDQAFGGSTRSETRREHMSELDYWR